MLLRYVLLVAATLLSLSVPAATADTKPSPFTDVLLGDRKRFLRANGMNKDHGGEERMIDVHKAIDAGKVQKLVGLEKSSQEVAALEKAVLPQNLFKFGDRLKMLEDEGFRAQRFEQWHQAKFSIGKIREELNVKRYRIFDELLLDYINNFKPSKDQAHVFERNVRVHFGANTVHELPPLPPAPLSWKEKIRAYIEKLRCRDGCDT